MACALLVSGPLTAQTVRLSEQLTRLGPPTVLDVEVRGSRVFFTLDPTTTTGPAPTLFSLSADGSGAPLALAEPFDPIDGTPFRHRDFLFSPDGTQLVVFGSRDSSEPTAFQGFQILSTATLAARRLVSAETAADIAFTPDTRRLLYFGANYLWSTPLDGSAPALTLGVFHQRDRTVRMAPDSVRGVIQLQRSTSPWELRSVTLDGSGPSLVLDTGRMSWVSAISADSLHVAYLAGNGNLYSARIDGSAPPVLLSSTHPGAALGALPVLAAGDRILYQAALGGTLGLALFSVPIDGSAPPLQLASRLQGFEELVLDPSAARVVFRSDAALPGTMELVAAAVDGSTPPLRLAPARGRALVAPDAATVVYDEGNYRPVFGSLLAVPLDGSAPPVRLVPLGAHGLELSRLAFDSSGAHVAYFGDEQVDGQYELSVVALDGTQAPLLLSGGLMAGGLGDPVNFTLGFTSDDAHLVFRTYAPFAYRAFTVPRDGARAPLELTRHCAAAFAGDVTRFEVNGTWAVYSGDLRVHQREELFSVQLTRRFRLSSPADGSVIPEFRISGDGSRVVFRQGELFDQRLYSVPIDGSAARIPLSPDGLEVEYLLALPGGDKVMFQGERGPSGPDEVWITRVDGSGAPVSVPVPSSPSVVLGPGGRWLAYRVGQDLVRVDATAVLPPLVVRSSVGSSISFSPEGDWLLFSSADGSALFSRRSDGTGTNQRLNGGSQSLVTFAGSPDNTRVVFLYRAGFEDRIAVAPIDGSGSATLIHSGVSFSVQMGQFAAEERVLVIDGSRLLVVALDGAPTVELPSNLAAIDAVFHHPGSAGVFVLGAQSRTGLGSLHRIPVDGSGPAELLQTFASFSSLLQPTFSADGARFGWRVDLERNLETDLFVVATDGSSSPVRVNRKLSYGSAVWQWSFALGGSAVAYLATERGVSELFARLSGDRKWARFASTPTSTVTLLR